MKIFACQANMGRTVFFFCHDVVQGFNVIVAHMQSCLAWLAEALHTKKACVLYTHSQWGVYAEDWTCVYAEDSLCVCDTHTHIPWKLSGKKTPTVGLEPTTTRLRALHSAD